MRKVLFSIFVNCLLLNPLFLNLDIQAQEIRYMSKEAVASIKQGKLKEEIEHRENLSSIPEIEQPLQNLSEKEEQVSHGLNPSTSHFGAYHFFLSVSPSGDLIEMDDQSIWSVHSSDRNKVLDWLTTDTLSLRANHDWFTHYNYRLKNQSVGTTLRVNLSMNPVLSNPRSHWIIAINGSRITLEDGSVWTTSGWDRDVTEQWLINDVVIVGTNDGWFRDSNPNILINTTLLPMAHARARCQH